MKLPNHPKYTLVRMAYRQHDPYVIMEHIGTSVDREIVGISSREIFSFKHLEDAVEAMTHLTNENIELFASAQTIDNTFKV